MTTEDQDQATTDREHEQAEIVALYANTDEGDSRADVLVERYATLRGLSVNDAHVEIAELATDFFTNEGNS